MISPIKYTITNIPKIKVYIQDFPRYFNTRFFNNFHIKFNPKFNLTMKAFLKKNIIVAMNVISNIGCNLKTKNQFQIKAKITTGLNHRLFIKEKICLIPKVCMDMIIHIYQRLNLKNKICIISSFKTNIIQRFKNLKVYRINVKMKVKSIVALFYKNYERGDLTFEEIFNNEELNTWQKLLWKEIK